MDNFITIFPKLKPGSRGKKPRKGINFRFFYTKWGEKKYLYLNLLLCEDIADKLKLEIGDYIEIQYYENNPYRLRIMKTLNEIRGFKLRKHSKNTLSIRLSTSFRWKISEPPFKMINKVHRVDYKMSYDKKRALFTLKINN